MRGTTRRPLAAERRVERPGSEETEVQKVLRYEGATPTKQLRIRVKILNWMRWAQEASGECPE